MEIYDQKAIDILQKIKKALPGSTIVKGAQSFFFLNNNVACFNGDLCLQTSMQTPFEGAVPGDELISILSVANKDGKFTIEEKNNKLVFQSKSSKGDILIEKDLDLISIIKELRKPKSLIKISDDFLLSLKLCKESASRDMSQGFLTSVLITNDKVISSDDLRITEIKIKPLKIKEQILIPATAIQNILAFNIKEIGVMKQWVYFSSEENIDIFIKTFSDEYPDISSFFDINGEKIEIPGDLTSIIRQIEVFCSNISESENYISININNGSCKVMAANQSGRIQKTVPIKYKGRPFSFLIPPSFFGPLIEKSDYFSVDLSGGKVLFEADGFRHVIAIITSDEEDEK